MKRKTMIRKQVYVEPRHDRMLKRRASQRGVTQAQLIREALDCVEMSARPGRRELDASAGRKAIQLETMRVRERERARAGDHFLQPVTEAVMVSGVFAVRVDQDVDVGEDHG